MTNEEKLKSLSTRELAEKLTTLAKYQDEAHDLRYTCPKDDCTNYTQAFEYWLDWLKEDFK